MTGNHWWVKNRQRKGLHRSPCCGLSVESAFPESRRFVPFAPALPSRDYRARLRKSQETTFESECDRYGWPPLLPSVPPGRSCWPLSTSDIATQAHVSRHGASAPRSPPARKRKFTRVPLCCAPRAASRRSGRRVVATPRDKQKHGCHCKCAVADDVSANRNKCRSERYRTSGSWTCDAGHKGL